MKEKIEMEFNMDPEVVQFRKEKLMWMDKYLRTNIDDEENFMSWLYIYPDGATEDGAESIAESLELYHDCLVSFTNIMMREFPKSTGY